jgi:ADP-heptose:LPS heptosyltransferase
VDLHDDVSTTVNYIIGKSSARYKFALHKENSLLFTHTVEKPDSRSHHVIERNLQLCRLFGLEPKESEARVRITLPEISIQKARQYIAKQYPGKKFLVGINISAGSDARFWGLRNFRALLKELKKYDVSYVIFCITRDLDYAIQITSERENIYYSPSLEDFSAVVSNVDLLFSPDTATVHIASAFSIPVFGLYVQYNTDDMIWSPYLTDFDYVLTKDATLKEMEAEPVINKFIPFLEKQLSKREQRNETSTEM